MLHRAGLIERALIAPYFVNYHLEHHLLVSCPCYRLKQANALFSIEIDGKTTLALTKDVQDRKSVV